MHLDKTQLSVARGMASALVVAVLVFLAVSRVTFINSEAGLLPVS